MKNLNQYPSNPVHFAKPAFRPGFVMGQRIIAHEQRNLDLQGGLAGYIEDERLNGHDMYKWLSTPVRLYTPLVDLDRYLLEKIEKVNKDEKRPFILIDIGFSYGEQWTEFFKRFLLDDTQLFFRGTALNERFVNKNIMDKAIFQPTQMLYRVFEPESIDMIVANQATMMSDYIGFENIVYLLKVGGEAIVSSHATNPPPLLYLDEKFSLFELVDHMIKSDAPMKVPNFNIDNYWSYHIRKTSPNSDAAKIDMERIETKPWKYDLIESVGEIVDLIRSNPSVIDGIRNMQGLAPEVRKAFEDFLKANL